MSFNIRRPGTYALAFAALILTATTALPAFALTPTPISASLRDQAATRFQTVQYQTQAQRQRQRTTRTYRDGYRDGYNAYASAPRVRRSYGYEGYGNPWGHCVMLGEHAPGRSAFPDWDIC